MRDTAEFATLAQPFLTRDPVGHSVLATSLDTVRAHDHGADVLWWVIEEPTGGTFRGSPVRALLRRQSPLHGAPGPVAGGGSAASSPGGCSASCDRRPA